MKIWSLYKVNLSNDLSITIAVSLQFATSDFRSAVWIYMLICVDRIDCVETQIGHLHEHRSFSQYIQSSSKLNQLLVVFQLKLHCIFIFDTRTCLLDVHTQQLTKVEIWSCTLHDLNQLLKSHTENFAKSFCGVGHLCVCLFVCLFVCWTQLETHKTAEPTEVLSVVWTPVGPRSLVFGGGPDAPGDGSSRHRTIRGQLNLPLAKSA